MFKTNLHQLKIDNNKANDVFVKEIKKTFSLLKKRIEI
jgi:hypothetical protein